MELPAGGGPAPSIRGMRDREEYWVTDPDNGNCPAAIGIVRAQVALGLRSALGKGRCQVHPVGNPVGVFS